MQKRSRVAGTKERVTSISGWSALYHTNSAQSVYQVSPIVGGLLELAGAWDQSTRRNKASKALAYRGYAKMVATWFLGNNTVLVPMYTGNAGPGAYEGRGAVLDAIVVNGGVSTRQGDAGGESTAEGLWAMILIKNAISVHSLGSSFSFDEYPGNMEDRLNFEAFLKELRA